MILNRLYELSGAQGYFVKYGTTDFSGNISTSTVSETYSQIGDLLPGNEYWFVVIPYGTTQDNAGQGSDQVIETTGSVKLKRITNMC